MKDARNRSVGPILGPLVVIAALLCCVFPLLLASGISLAFLRGVWPWVGVGLVVLGVIGFIFYLRHRRRAHHQDNKQEPERYL
jgi:Na+-driven multidrug efflux pump